MTRLKKCYGTYKSIEYQIIYKKRKTYGIYIDVYGNVELRVPKDAKEAQIDKILEERYDWIIKKSMEMKERTKGFKKKAYVQGENFLFLGEEYPIEIIENNELNRDYVEFIDHQLKVYIRNYEELKVQEALKRYYYQQCKAVIENRIHFYSNIIKVKPKSIRLSDNKSNWGTCNSKRELSFNWKLIMAPIEVIDYVVVHELCHILHMNHDRSFWRLVGKYMPNYEESKAWLAQSNWKMTL